MDDDRQGRRVLRKPVCGVLCADGAGEGRAALAPLLADLLRKRGEVEEAIALMEKAVAAAEVMKHPQLEQLRTILARWRAEHTSE